jgi:hypothetical protein
MPSRRGAPACGQPLYVWPAVVGWTDAQASMLAAAGIQPSQSSPVSVGGSTVLRLTPLGESSCLTPSDRESSRPIQRSPGCRGGLSHHPGDQVPDGEKDQHDTESGPGRQGGIRAVVPGCGGLPPVARTARGCRSSSRPWPDRRRRPWVTHRASPHVSGTRLTLRRLRRSWRRAWRRTSLSTERDRPVSEARTWNRHYYGRRQSVHRVRLGEAETVALPACKS